MKKRKIQKKFKRRKKFHNKKMDCENTEKLTKKKKGSEPKKT